MPVTKSAQKALRQSIKIRKRKLEQFKSVKKVVKTYKKLIADGKVEEAGKYLPTVYKALDKAAKTNLIKKNKASRLKSRLPHKLIAKSSKASS